MKILGFDISKIINLDKTVPERARIINKIVESQHYRGKQDIRKWLLAIEEAENPNNSNKERLLDIYREIEIDPHVSSQVQARFNKTLSKEFKVCNEKGEEVPEKTKLLDSSWFFDFIQMVLESKLYGYSLIQFGDIKKHKFEYVKLVDRYHVKPNFQDPEKSLVLIHKNGSDGIPYNTYPFNQWCMQVGKERDLGLFYKIAPVFLYKKWALAAWSEFSEVFGMPTRIGKTDVRDESLRVNMERMLAQMGSRAYAVLDPNDEVEFVETNKSGTGATVYEGLANFCNKEISKAIIGGTGVSDEKSFAGSSEVHENTAEEYGDADRKFIEFFVNDKLFPFLNQHGFGLDGHYFKYDMSEYVSIKDKAEIVYKLSQSGKIVEDQYILDTFGIPVQGKSEPVKIQNTMDILNQYYK
jgi:phage gp29-like protein